MRRLCDPRDDTKSYDLVFDRLSGERCFGDFKDTPLSRVVVRQKGLILRQEIEGREERKCGSDCSTTNQEHSEDIPLESVRLISYRLTLTSSYSIGSSPPSYVVS